MSSGNDQRVQLCHRELVERPQAFMCLYVLLSMGLHAHLPPKLQARIQTVGKY